MEDKATTDALIRALALTARIVTLGGVAVIAHGYSRNTHDADIWIEPMGAPTDWSKHLLDVLRQFPDTVPLSIGDWQPVFANDLPQVVDEDGVIRISGLERPLDIFRCPNELDASSFDEVWERATPLDDGTRLPDTIDLLVTKQLTGRDKDRMDILFLEQKAETESLEKLATAGAAEILTLLDRFLTPNLAAAACRHADPSVRTKARGYLAELAAEGDPFAADLLRELPEKN